MAESRIGLPLTMTTDSHDSATIIDLDPEQVTVERDDISSSPPNPSQLPKRKSGLTRWAMPVAALLLAAIAGGWLYRDVISDYYPSDRVMAVIDRAATLEKSNGEMQVQVLALERLTTQLSGDLNTLETKSTTVGTVAATVQDGLVATDARVAGLESGLLETRQQVADLAKIAPAPTIGNNVDDNAAVSALIIRLATLEKDVESLKAQKGQSPDFTTLSQSLADLKAKIAAGTGFMEELQRIQRMVPAASGLEVLTPHAEAGLPDAKALADELAALATTLPKPQEIAAATTDDSYFTQAWNMLSDLIKVRNTGEVDWPSAATTAASLAEAGDLAGAIASLNALEGSKPLGVQQWLNRASGRLSLEAALQSVEDGVLRTLASQKAN